ncbi:hypothetical protein QCD60_19710 [Pokkaliibacter sp. MBI-7]|uniref:hypothetical protein n=1 Tax=Pokkaliibacter sp. MBI-7 TaxID=3040600 RepID=UPI0024490301|nr:hypothetical protein [Pokkaliibacter sp. MBI-7]MDH2434771.1 hypothetical protein [Pokkaliibacter sp. MBI-7]
MPIHTCCCDSGVFDIVDQQDDLLAIGLGEDDALTAIPVKDQVAVPLSLEQRLLKYGRCLTGDQVADKAEGHPGPVGYEEARDMGSILSQ